MLLVIVRLIGDINVCQHVSDDFSQDNVLDSQFEKLNAMTEDKQKKYF